MGLDPNSRVRFNLEHIKVLLLEGTPLGMEVLAQVLHGFGAKDLNRCFTVEAARHAVQTEVFDLAIVDSLGASGEGYEFVSWLRRSGIKPNYSVPVLLTAGHTPTAGVAKARDCGAHFILRKPLRPIAVLERIVWIGREGRHFVECDTYCGPDRRFKNQGAPGGAKGRRRDDQDLKLAEAANPSIDQGDGLGQTRQVRM